ncbi:MAG: ABC transporter ATP-binding protein [Deltaproteobacteria bacterium]|jgi:peptide/nickel transport system ATP-binding protein/oligopeptide transport system ATP-binding protein|nr:ABC transporter ATP-binding protein [Deltaproteobacteria bacterium]MBW2469511.1 ABC transporter ATP-binding protein [Deltaproteobacteria bacterium]
MEENENKLLSVEELKVYFRSEDEVARAVDGVSFDVEPEETVCLVGESGCGKTVTALSIMGLVPIPPGEIAGGRILFRGQNLLNLNDRQMQEIRGNQIGMVFQEPLTSLNPVFTIGDQIGEAIQIHQTAPQNEVVQRSRQLLKDVGIADPAQRLNDYPHQLSGGQRQRVMIAMALACNPELIIADEPTTALDVTVQAQILRLLETIQKDRSMSVLYITHDLGVVSKVADRICVMYAGIIAEQGKKEAVLKTPKHPYTQALLASLPHREKRGQRLYSIPGTVPNPAYKPGGCPFHPRCRHALQSCREQYPEMCDYEDGHRARCPVIFNDDMEKGFR